MEALKYNIFNLVQDKGTKSERLDILGNGLKNKVYTKKVPINTDFNGVEIVSVSLTSHTEDFNDAAVSDIRINTKNRRKKFCNLFIDKVPYDLLAFVYECIK